MERPLLLRELLLKEEEDDLVILLGYRLIRNNRRRKRKHRWWVHDIVRNGLQQGAYHNLLNELLNDDAKFQQYMRLTREQFTQLLFHVGPYLFRTSRCREVITPRQRLAICLRFLATGESFRSLAFSYRVGITTVSNIVSEVCQVIWDVLSPLYMKLPTTSDEWKVISNGFMEKWNYPNCLGSLDGKHVVMKAPPKSGSLYYNYKGTFSIVLLALVDSNLRFIAVDVGSYGRNSDAGIFATSNLGNAITGNTINFPEDAPLPEGEHLGPVPYVVIGIGAFPLQRHLMRPYPGRNCTQEQQIYNYRHSRARRTVENAFGVMAARWRVYHSKLAVKPQVAIHVVKATCILHNMLISQTNTSQIANLLDVQGHGNEALEDMAGVDAVGVRNTFKEYFGNVSPVPWQRRHVERGVF